MAQLKRNKGLLLSLLMLVLPMATSAQEVIDSLLIRDIEADSVAALAQDGKPKPSKYIPTEKDMKQTFFQGFTAGADVLNMALYFLSSKGELEGSLRLNLLNTYFPVAEIGMGRCNTTNYNTKIHFSTNAPYFKIGCDYNILNNKWQTNKLFVGIRYGISNFNYSFDGPDQTDPIWGGSGPMDVSSINATSHYGEFVFGCQVKLWSFIHMGWTGRMKKEFYTTKSIYSHPYYIPGYGTTVSGTNWTLTYSICFDLNWGKKKPTAKEVVANAVNDLSQPKTEDNQ